jgi:superoxide reductase
MEKKQLTMSRAIKHVFFTLLTVCLLSCSGKTTQNNNVCFTNQDKTINNNAMTTTQKFFLCNHCGNLISHLIDSGVGVVCCGEKMEELIPNTFNASVERHTPAVSKTDCGIKVQVGSALHPMTPEHHISFVYVKTDKGGRRFNLGDSPEVEFCTCTETPLAVFAYCNLHGMWMVEL